MKTIAIGTLKGGTGKTTLAFNLSGVLAEENKVLMIDVDPQCNLSNNAGINIAMSNTFSARELFADPPASPAQLIVKHPIPELPNLDVIPSNIYLIETENGMINKPARESILANYIDTYKEELSEYDYIIIDTNPSMGLINQNAFLAADSILLISDVDNNSRIGVELFMFLWKKIAKALKKENNIKALILNRADSRTTLTGDIWEYYRDEEDLKGLLVEPPIKDRIAFRRAALKKVPINLYQAGKESTAELRKLVEALKERGVF